MLLSRPRAKPPEPCMGHKRLPLLVSFLLALVSILSVHAQTPSNAPNPTFSILSVPTTLSLPSLNASARQIRLSLPPRSTYITLNICGLTSNATLLPDVRISTSEEASFDITRVSRDHSSGGVGIPNRRARGSDTWNLSWDKGFANWTRIGLDESSSEGGVEMLLGLGLTLTGNLEAGLTVASGNVVIQLSISEDGEHVLHMSLLQVQADLQHRFMGCPAHPLSWATQQLTKHFSSRTSFYLLLRTNPRTRIIPFRPRDFRYLKCLPRLAPLVCHSSSCRRCLPRQLLAWTIRCVRCREVINLQGDSSDPQQW
jgi:hypothetical protein